jgi:hypothetical protein
VATFRDDELEVSHPLRIVLGELATAPSVVRMPLPPLSREGVATLAEPHGVDARGLYRTTGGNPFFVTVLAAGSTDLPATVRDAVLGRAARLGADARRLLDAVAIVPGAVELALLDAITDDLVALDECLASGMLLVENGGVWFRHELARLAIESHIAPHRARELHRAALRALVDARAPSILRRPSTTHTPRATTPACSRTHPKLPRTPRVSARIGRPLRILRVRSASEASCPRSSARRCSSGSHTSAT